MRCMEMAVAVLFPDTSFWQKCRKIRCQWLLCIGRLVSKHRQVMLPCTGEDYWCSFTTGQWGRHRSMFVLQLTGFPFISESAHMVHCPTRVGTVGSCVAFERDSPGAFGVFFIFFLQGEPSSNAGPTRADWMFGWLVLSDLTATEWDLVELISCSWHGWSLERVWDARVACGEDCMWSWHVSITFWGGV